MMVLAFGLLFVASLFAAWRVWRRVQYFLHMLQLEAYHLNEYGAWLGRRMVPLVAGPSHVTGFVVVTGLLALGRVTGAGWPVAVCALLWCIAFASSYRYTGARKKKPLKYTNRLKRLLAVAGGLALLPPAVFSFLALGRGMTVGAAWYLGGWLLADLAAPLWVILAALLLEPLEWSFREGFKRKARRKLDAAHDLTVIGITGSYGKTSVKFITAEILRQRYGVLATPASYNTPMGICIVVNNQLRTDHRVLVLEMGARYAGDIRELCQLVPPDIGIVTAVGKAHLETMGPIDNIARVKAELIRHMKPGGPVVLNADDPRVAAMAEVARGPVWRVSVDGNPAEISARDLKYGPEGSVFTVRDETGSEQRFETRLLGRHNVQNILFGLAVGRILGLRLRQMAHAVQRLQPVEHRLELRRQGEYTVIDDAFNANPEGARSALDILSQFSAGQRIVITPGMIELGGEQERENRSFGSYMAGRADLVLLVGPEQTAPIRAGLLEANFPEGSVHVFRTLFDAQEFLKTAVRPGDTVLYENDLPDQYTEPT